MTTLITYALNSLSIGHSIEKHFYLLATDKLAELPVPAPIDNSESIMIHMGLRITVVEEKMPESK